MQDYVDVEDADFTGEFIRRLRHLEKFVPPEQMGEIWIFPPLEEPEGTREFVLFTRMAGDEERRVFSARERRDGNGAAASNGHARQAGAGGSGGGASAGGNGGGPGAADARAGEVEEAEHGAGPDGSQSIVEHGRAPAGRLPGLVERLLRRLGDQRAPIHVAIEGSRIAWDDLVTRLAEEAVSAGN